MVGVDAETFQALGDERWPFTHDEHAKVIDRLREDGAKVIAVDIQFSEPSNTDEETFALLDAIKKAGNVVVSTTEVDDRANGNAFTFIVPQKVLDSRERGAVNRYLRRTERVEIAYGNFPTDPGGTLRRVTYDGDGLKTFSVAVAERVTGKRIKREDLGGDSAWIDYYGPPRTIRHVPYSDVRLGRTKPGEFRDKIVVVGATAPVLQDVHGTSTSGDSEMAGPEIQAHAIATALAGLPPGGLLDRARRLPDRPARPGRAGGQPALLRPSCPRARDRRGGALRRRDPAGLQRRHRALARLSPRRPGADGGGRPGRPLRDRGVRARANARHVRALRARVGGGGGPRAGGGAAARRRRPRRDRDVQRPPGLHELRRVARARPGDHDPEPLPDRHGRRRHPAPRRHAGGLHGRRHHGRVRRADRDGRPRRPRAGRRAGQARRARAGSTTGCAPRWASRSPSAWASG